MNKAQAKTNCIGEYLIITRWSVSTQDTYLHVYICTYNVLHVMNKYIVLHVINTMYNYYTFPCKHIFVHVFHEKTTFDTAIYRINCCCCSISNWPPLIVLCVLIYSRVSLVYTITKPHKYYGMTMSAHWRNIVSQISTTSHELCWIQQHMHRKIACPSLQYV